MKNKKLLCVFVVLGLLATPITTWAAKSMGIVATVNEDAISAADVTNRMKLIFASSGLQSTPENEQKVKPQALNILIDEQLKLQAARKNQIQVSQEEIAEAFKTMASNNKLTPSEFADVMKQSGVPISTLISQIESELAWGKVVSGVLRPRVEVTENDVNAQLDRLKKNVGQTEYEVAEIFMPISNAKEEVKTKDLIQNLIAEIKSGRAPFNLMARQFSKSPSAAQGGKMGWIQAGDLPKELDVVVKSLSKGQISPPVRGLSGFHILTLLDKRNISTETLPDPDDVLNSIGLQRLDKLQKRHLTDLRSGSFIDRRDEG